MRNSIYQKFKKVSSYNSQSKNCYEVVDVPFSKFHKLGIDTNGCPIFFIKSSLKGFVPNINLELISIQFNELCKLRKNTVSSILESYYTVISLKTNQEDYIVYFLNVVSLVIEKIGDFPIQQELLNEIEKIVELFRNLSLPPIKTIQGLWAELFVIEQSSNPAYLVKSWHKSPTDIFDFNDGIDRIEVKSTSRNNRIHRFSHNQLTTNEKSNVVIASMYVQQSGQGKTVLDLKQAIDSKLVSVELRFLLAEIISKTLGSDFEKAGDYYFDYSLAHDSYRKYNSKDIPSINNNLIPVEISNIHYDCDLSKIHFIDVISDIFPNSELIKSL